MPVSPAVGRLLAAAEEFARQHLLPEDGEMLAGDLVALRHVADLVEVGFSATAETFASTDEWMQRGSLSPFDWIRHNCRMSGYATSDRLRVGEALTRLPQSHDALVRAEIGFGHLSLIAGVVRAVDSVNFDESPLLEHAREESVGKFSYACERARAAGNPEEFARDQAFGVEARTLRIVERPDGSVGLGAILDEVGAGVVRSALEALAVPTGKRDRREKDRRLADALVELCERNRQVAMNVTVSLETMLGLQGDPGEMEHSAPLSIRTLERLRCDCTLRRVILDDRGVVLDLGRGRRTVSPAQRRALQLRYKRCCFPGCQRPGRFAHHLNYWSHGGDSDLDNYCLLCGRHHWLVHEGGWRLGLNRKSEFEAVRPPLMLGDPRARAPGRLVA